MSGQHHSDPCPNNILIPTAGTTNLSNTFGAGTLNLHGLSQAVPGDRQAPIPISCSVGYQASGLDQGGALRTSQNTVFGTSSMPRWNSMVSSSAPQTGVTGVPNYSNNYPNQSAPFGHVSQQVEPTSFNRDQHPLFQLDAAGAHPSRQYVSSVPNPLNQFPSLVSSFYRCECTKCSKLYRHSISGAENCQRSSSYSVRTKFPANCS